MSEIVEFRVKLNGIKDGKDTNDNLLFKDIYDKGKNILEDIIKNQDKNKNNLQNTNSVSNIIAFCGDRGTGKTSAMNEFSEKYMVESLKCVEVLPTIDPTLLSSNDSVLEIVIAKLFKGLDIEKISDPERQRKILSEFEKVYNQLSTLYQKKKERFVKDFNGGNLELISRLQSSLDITNTLENIINLYLEDKNEKTRILIKIDDVDMNLKNAYAMIEEIRKYLNVNNLIILVAFNDVQMNALLSKKFNNELGENNSNILASNYLTKLFPPQNRLYMPKLDKFILSNEATFVGYDKDGKEVKNNSPEKSIVETILGEIFNKTRLIFLKNKYGFNTLIPTNLRELSQLRLFLENLETVKDGNNVFDDIYENETNIKIRKNLILFRDYFLYERINSDLSYDELEFLRMLPNLQAGKVNKEIHLYFTNKAKDLEIPLKVLTNEDEDQSVLNMARIITEINIVRENDKGANDQFVYYVKCLYSMIILENTLIAISDNKPNNLLGNIGKYIIGSYKYEDKQEDGDEDDNNTDTSSQKNKKRKFEYEFYPIKDVKDYYIKDRNVRIDNFKLLKEYSIEPKEEDFISFDSLLNIQKDFFSGIDKNIKSIFEGNEKKSLANYVFSLYISYGKFDGDEFIKSAKIHNGSVGRSRVHFSINNLIFNLLDIEKSFFRNFEDLIDLMIEDIKKYLKNINALNDNNILFEGVDELDFNNVYELIGLADKIKKLKNHVEVREEDLMDRGVEDEKITKTHNQLEKLYELTMRLCNIHRVKAKTFNDLKIIDKNVYLLFPIYSIDYVEKINSFSFRYKNGVSDSFYRLMFDNFFEKLIICNEKIIKSNQFLTNTNLNILASEFTKNLNNKETKDMLEILIKKFLTTATDKKINIPIIPTISSINKYLEKNSNKELKKLCLDLKKLNDELEKLKTDDENKNNKIKKLIEEINNDINIYETIIETNSTQELDLSKLKNKKQINTDLNQIINGTN